VPTRACSTSSAISGSTTGSPHRRRPGISESPGTVSVGCSNKAFSTGQVIGSCGRHRTHGVISHGAAARLHGLDGFDGHEPVDILCKKGSWPGHPGIVITHFTRGLTDDDVVDIDGIPVLSVPTTLALLRPHSGTEATIRAIASAVRDGWPLIELRSTAARWRTRGRPGPSFCIEVLDRLAESGIRAQASTGASISSAADQGSRFKVTTSPVTSSHRSPVQI
jgi:hypothetical protein